MFFRIILLLLLLPVPAAAQNLNESLSRVGEAYAQLYVEPLLNGLGADLNAGLFHTARAGKLPYDLDLYLGVKGSGMFISNADKSFDLTYPSNVSFDYRVGSRLRRITVPATLTVRDAPTIFGSTEAPEATVSAQLDTTFFNLGVAFPVSIDTTFTAEMIGGLVNMNIAPFATIHAGIGSILGTGITLRWTPRVEVEDVGAIESYGIGISHSLSQYFPVPPLDVAVLVAWHDFQIDSPDQEDIVGGSTFALSLIGSRRFGMITLYGGAQIEESKIHVSYMLDPGSEIENETEVDSIPIEFSVEGINRGRGILGTAFHLGPVQVNADIGFGQVNTVSAGFGLAF